MKVKKFRKLVNAAFVLIGLSQIMFVFYLVNRFGFEELKIGALIMTVGSICLMSESVVAIDKWGLPHWVLAILYFVFISVGSVLVSRSFMGVHSIFSQLATVTAILMGLGTLVIVLFRKILWAQFWALIMSTIWGILFYIFVI